MESNKATIINAAGVEMPVTNVVFHDNFIVAYTDSFSVRFEKVGDELQNGDFKITGDLDVFLPVPTAETVAEEATPAPEPAIEDETADVVVDAAATPVATSESIAAAEATAEAATPAEGTVIGVDPAAEGGDTTVETVVEPAPDAPVTTE